MGSISVFQKLKHRPIGYSFLPSLQTSYLYRSMRYSGHWQCNSGRSSPYGSLFGLEFSPQGNVVILACEKRSILIIDPYTHQCVKAVQGAHTDCVNCVRFLDNRTFLTCSDDTTLAVWDIRNMDEKVSSLVGHSKWVKSIEYSHWERLLVTTGFDDTVRLWETDKLAGGHVLGRVAFHCRYITRLKLTPDAKKMIIATSVGFMLVIHELTLRTLEEDMAGFQPVTVWMSHLEGDHGYIETEPFIRNRNRVQFVRDFLPEMFPWCFNSIEVHPEGTCVLSRFVSEEFESEWTTVHALDSTTEGRLPLLWYKEEPNRERDFIKEVCFSKDGNVIVSPFAFGVRLFSPTVDCGVYPHLHQVSQQKPSELQEINSITCHESVVLTTRFSPVHMLFASGCLNGRVCFHQPRLT